MKTILLLGSNLENPIVQLETAIARIAELTEHYRVSSVYKTAAWGNTNQNDFYNQAMEIDTDMQPADLLEKLIGIEVSMGRKRVHKWEPRIIDIDIIAMGDMVVQTNDLQIPHPYMTERMFVMIPMLELQADWMHPALHKHLKTLIEECTDSLAVHKI